MTWRIDEYVCDIAAIELNTMLVIRFCRRSNIRKISYHSIDVEHAARVLLSNLLYLPRRKARLSKRVHRGQVGRRK